MEIRLRKKRNFMNPNKYILIAMELREKYNLLEILGESSSLPQNLI